MSNQIFYSPFAVFAKTRKAPLFVIPAKAGIQCFQIITNSLDPGACPGPEPGFTGVTTFYGLIPFDIT